MRYTSRQMDLFLEAANERLAAMYGQDGRPPRGRPQF